MRLFNVILIWVWSVSVVWLSACHGSQRSNRPADIVQPRTIENGNDTAGDAPIDHQPGQTPGNGPAERDIWPFRPASMRLHPLTHVVVSADGQRTIEARLEFFDQFKHGTKAIARVRFELTSRDSDAAIGSAGAPGVWDIDLADLDLNARHFDPVTRTYLFRLSLDPSKVYQQSMTLKARVESPRRALMSTLEILIE